MRRFRHDLHALSGAYAIDAIDDDVERDKFERHMRRCQQCTGEVRGLTETSGRLGLAASRPPPEQMRGSVLAAISRTRQLPPVVEQEEPEPSPQPQPQARSRHARPARGRRPSMARRPGPMLAFTAAFGAACFIVAVVLAITLISVSDQLNASKAKNAALTSVLTAPDSRAKTQEITAGARATVVYSLRRHAMIFTPHQLPPLPSGKVYELWLIGPPVVRPAGLLPAGPAASNPILASGVVRGDEVGLTVEPAGGTKKPTTTPILIIPLRA